MDAEAYMRSQLSSIKFENNKDICKKYKEMPFSYYVFILEKLFSQIALLMLMCKSLWFINFKYTNILKLCGFNLTIKLCDVCVHVSI